MRIVSKTKDYYDFVSKQFGEDPNCVWNRATMRWDYYPDNLYEHGRLSHQYRCNFVHSTDIASIEGNYQGYGVPRTWTYYGGAQLLVGELLFPILIVRGDKNVIQLAQPNVFPFSNGKVGNWYTTFFNKDGSVSGRPSQDRIQRLLRCLKQPCVLMKEKVWCVPNLKDIEGLVAILPPEQAWQAIYHAQANIVKSNADNQPPVSVSNESKIQKAGFDLKTSFRNPINKRNPKKG